MSGGKFVKWVCLGVAVGLLSTSCGWKSWDHEVEGANDWGDPEMDRFDYLLESLPESPVSVEERRTQKVTLADAVFEDPATPEDALVFARGVDEVLRAEGYTGRHFQCNPANGFYVVHYDHPDYGKLKISAESGSSSSYRSAGLGLTSVDGPILVADVNVGPPLPLDCLVSGAVQVIP